MLRNIQTLMLIGCVALPLGLFAASKAHGTEPDDKLAKEIQKAVSKDDSLSATAHNVTITIQEGVITLQGSVLSDAESQAIQGKAESLVLQQKDHDFAKAPDIRNNLTLILSN